MRALLLLFANLLLASSPVSLSLGPDPHWVRDDGTVLDEKPTKSQMRVLARRARAAKAARQKAEMRENVIAALREVAHRPAAHRAALARARAHLRQLSGPSSSASIDSTDSRLSSQTSGVEGRSNAPAFRPVPRHVDPTVAGGAASTAIAEAPILDEHEDRTRVSLQQADEEMKVPHVAPKASINDAVKKHMLELTRKAGQSRMQSSGSTGR